MSASIHPPTTASRLLLALIVASSAVYAQLLTPIGTVNTSTTGWAWLGQMAFDAGNDRLYLTTGSTIVAVHAASSLPLVPPSAVPWSCVSVAGGSTTGLPSATEVTPQAAKFNMIMGVAGWARYPSEAQAGGSTAWMGLWVCDYDNHAVRYVNFDRGGNVTLVAGSSNARAGATDGIGAAALLAGPGNVAWGYFPTANITGATAPSPLWTSVVYWSDYNGWVLGSVGGHCIRQGIPLHNGTYAPLDGIPSESLADMVLNVTTFAGECGTPGAPGASGLVFNRSLLYCPWGVALTTGAACGDLLFVGEQMFGRIAIIAPMYPSGARYLTSVNKGLKSQGASASGGGMGVSIARAYASGWGSSGAVRTVELFVGAFSSNNITNVSVSFTLNAANGSIHAVSSSGSIVAMTGLAWATNTAFVPYAPNSSYNGTLVVFGGNNNYDATSYHVLQFYCCLGPEYSAPMTWRWSSSRTGSATMSSSKRTSPSISQRHNTRTTKSDSITMCVSRSSLLSISEPDATRTTTRSLALLPSTTLTPTNRLRPTSSRSSSVSASASPATGRNRREERRTPPKTVRPTLTPVATRTPLASSPHRDATADALTATASSTSAAISSMAFIATTPVMMLQRMNSIFARLSCSSLDITSRPSKVANPSATALRCGESTPSAARIGPDILAPYWRLSWWWLLGEAAIGAVAFAAINLIELYRR